MTLHDVEKALHALDQSGASPQIKARAHRLVTEMIASGASASQSDRRAERWLKYGLGWCIVVIFVALSAAAFGHAVGLWTIAHPEQLPWIWGGSLSLGVCGPWYLLRVFFPKASASGLPAGR